jgi:predicted membrane protein
MEQNENDKHQFGGAKGTRIWSGVILLLAGVLLLCYKMGAPIPGWFFTWPVLLIAIGILTGIKSRFHNPGAFIMIVVGGIFLIDQTSPELNFHNYILPAILIGVGLIYILRPRHTWSGRRGRKWNRSFYEAPNFSSQSPEPYNPTMKNAGVHEDDAEYIEINTAFGSVKKIILSKNFRGGEINCFMGGTEINLIQADLQKPARLEINNVFGGAKLLVPSNWDVKNEVTAVFGGIEDKRNITTAVRDPEKVIILNGTCVFGGIEITNY